MIARRGNTPLAIATQLTVAAALLAVAAARPCRAAGPEARDMVLVGHHDLQKRPAYQPTVHAQGGRIIAYVGHHGGEEVNSLTRQVEPNGTSILDVTDPARPTLLAHVPAHGDGAQMVRICDGSALPHGKRSAVYLLRTEGNAAHAVWDVSDPRAPVRVSTVVSGLSGTHKSWWDCGTGTAYLVADGRPRGWRSSRILLVYDLADPAAPRFVRAFGLPGQEPGATGAVPPGLHGPIAAGNRLYLAWGTSSHGVIQIVDVSKLLKGEPGVKDPFAPSRTSLLYPQVGRLDMPSFWGAHTTFPLLRVNVPEFGADSTGHLHDFLVTTSEALADGCQEPRHMAWMVDITDETKPFPVSSLQVAEATGRFCSRGGRFGPHATNESFAPIFYRKVVFVSWFNAGVRAFDVRDPFRPREIAHFVPARADGAAIQTNNVEVDDRGYVYAVDRDGAGLDVLQLAGAAAGIAAGR